MRIILDFLKDRRRILYLYCGLVFVFGMMFFLYELPGEPFAYGVLLISLLLTLYGACDFWRYYQKSRRMQMALKNRTFYPELLSDMEGDTKFDQCYRELLALMNEERHLQESKSRIARREAEEYYSMWVHQIKTPISALQLLLQTSETAEGIAQDTLREMKLELFKIEQYVSMALTYVRLGESVSDFHFVQVPVDQVVKQAVRKYSQMFILKKLSLVYEPTGKMLLTDEKWLLFVLEQVLSNALKYTKAGSISIRMEGDVLIVSDTGIGIAPEDLPRVFEKGFTGFNGRQDKKSTGIGLYLCKSVMDKLGHSIWITSENEVGTRVYMDLGRRKLHTE